MEEFVTKVIKIILEINDWDPKRAKKHSIQVLRFSRASLVFGLEAIKRVLQTLNLFHELFKEKCQTRILTVENRVQNSGPHVIRNTIIPVWIIIVTVSLNIN